MNLFMGVFVLGAFLTVIANLVADLLYGVVDPRIRIRK
jgi:ABC-type dipeptide/oligopeptide/nickel transport system permease component